MLNRTHPDSPDAFHDSMFVLDLDQSCAEGEEVQGYLETCLELVDPASGAWSPREARRRAHGASN